MQTFHAALSFGYSAKPAASNGHIFWAFRSASCFETITAKNPHQVVLNGEKELRGPRVPWRAARPRAGRQCAALVRSGADDVQSA